MNNEILLYSIGGLGILKLFLELGDVKPSSVLTLALVALTFWKLNFTLSVVALVVWALCFIGNVLLKKEEGNSKTEQ